MSALIPFVNGLAVPPAASPATAVPTYIGNETKATLVAEARRRGLSTSGTKSEIVARLRAHASGVDQLVEASDGVPDVGSVALGDEGVADGEQLGDGESPSTEAGDEDAQAFGHGD